MKIYAPHHTALSVSNIKKSTAFYEILGFEKVYYWVSEDKKLEIAHLRNDSFILELFCFKQYEKLPEHAKSTASDLPVLGTKHLGMRVDSIEQAAQHLGQVLEIDEIEITLGRTEIKYFFIKDPDEILIEIVEDKRTL